MAHRMSRVDEFFAGLKPYASSEKQNITFWYDIPCL